MTKMSRSRSKRLLLRTLAEDVGKKDGKLIREMKPLLEALLKSMATQPHFI